MVARWTPSLRILLGVLLLTTPALWQPGADYATVTYDASRVEHTDEYLRLDGGVLSSRIEGLACYGLDESRYCALETHVARRGPITVNRTDRAFNRSAFVAADGFYRPVANDSGENVTLALEPVRPETVLRELSRPADELPAPARRTLGTDEYVTVRFPVERPNPQERRSAYFVAANDSYYLLEETHDVHDGAESPLETPVKVVLFALGLGFVLRGQAKRLERDDSP